MRFSNSEKNELRRIARNDGKIWTRANTATIHFFGGHYYIKKRPAGGFFVRWVNANISEDTDKGKYIVSLAEIR